MLYRLGQVIWWTSIVLGVAIFGIAFVAASGRGDIEIVVILTGLGVATVVVGRAIRYIICGD